MGILAGRVAVVLGASRGIGHGIARTLGSEGAIVFAGARTVKAGETRVVGPAGVKVPGSLEETVQEIEKAGGQAVAVHCDVRDDASIERLIGRAIEDHGRIDILACSLLPDVLDCSLSLDTHYEGKFWQLPLSAWDDQFVIGPRAYYAAARAAAPRMSKAGSGLMVFLSSPGGALDFYGVPYCVARAATDRLAQAVDNELREQEVTAVSLWPNYIRTERVTQARAGEDVGFSMDSGSDFSKEANSPELVGLAVAHLAADPDRLALSGAVHLLADLSARYGLRDIDGSEAYDDPDLRDMIETTGTIAPSAYIKKSP